VVAFAGVFIGSTTSLSAQERPDLTSIGNGARAAGMGYAITAATDDIYSIGWNPAGLSYLARPEFGVSGRIVLMATDASAWDFVPTYPQYVARGELTATADLFEFLGFAYPLHVGDRTVTIAAAYRRFIDGPRIGRFESGQRVSNGRYVGSTDYKSGPGLRAISPSIGVEVTPRVRVGVTANIISGSFTHSVRGPFPYKYTAHEEDFTGLAIDAGAIVQATDELRLAVQATLPHERSYTWDNDTTIRDVTREVPLALSLGAMYQLDAKSKVLVDFRHTPWSDARLVNDATDQSIVTFDGINNTYSFHAGYERDVTNEDRAASRRLGWYWKRLSIADYLAAPITANGITVGQTWVLPRATVDAAVAYQRTERWTRHQNSERRFSMRNQDVTINVSVRRRYKGRA
jgi:long-subunit fatty acid transport protein